VLRTQCHAVGTTSANPSNSRCTDTGDYSVNAWPGQLAKTDGLFFVTLTGWHTRYQKYVRVVQTASSLIEAGCEAFVVSDATASRTIQCEAACITRLNASGASRVTTEMVVFGWLGKAGTAAFKALLPLIRN